MYTNTAYIYIHTRVHTHTRTNTRIHIHTQMHRTEHTHTHTHKQADAMPMQGCQACCRFLDFGAALCRLLPKRAQILDPPPTCTSTSAAAILGNSCDLTWYFCAQFAHLSEGWQYPPLDSKSFFAPKRDPWCQRARPLWLVPFGIVFEGVSLAWFYLIQKAQPDSPVPLSLQTKCFILFFVSSAFWQGTSFLSLGSTLQRAQNGSPLV